MKKENKTNKMLKIVYFDEISATDYLIIKNEGIAKEIEQHLTSKDREEKFDIEGSLWAKIPLLFYGIGGSLKGEGKIKFENNDNNIIKKTISNSLLSDFLKEIIEDKNIKEFKGYIVKPHPNSMTFIKMFTPYLKMIASEFEIDGATLNFANIDDAFEDGKGYYEMVATKPDLKKVFRFNINSFRNNYTIADLTKMNLTYIGIKVGEIEEENLDIINELNMNENSYSIQLEDIEELETKNNPLMLPIYDIILAGVDECEN